MPPGEKSETNIVKIANVLQGQWVLGEMSIILTCLIKLWVFCVKGLFISKDSSSLSLDLAEVEC